jgi:putative ABC transport system permease protein
MPNVKVAVPAAVHVVNSLNSVTGVDFKKLDQLTGGLRIIKGRLPKNQTEVLIDPAYARQIKKGPGETIQFFNRDYTIAGVTEGGLLAQVLLDLTELQERTENRGRVSQFMLKLDDPTKLNDVVRNIKGQEAFKDYLVMSIQQFASLFSVDRLPGLQPFINVVVGVAMIVGFLTISLTMYTAVLERTREIGILKSLGAKPSFIMSLLMRESVLLAVMGTLVGIVLTYGAKFAIETLVPASLKQEVVYEWWAIALLASVVGSMLGTLYPSLKALKQDAIEALSYE